MLQPVPTKPLCEINLKPQNKNYPKESRFFPSTSPAGRVILRCFFKLIRQGIPDFSEIFSFSFIYFEKAKPDLKGLFLTAVVKCLKLCILTFIDDFEPNKSTELEHRGCDLFIPQPFFRGFIFNPSFKPIATWAVSNEPCPFSGAGQSMLSTCVGVLFF